MIFDLLIFLFGVTVEIIRLLCGEMLIPVSHPTIVCLATLMSLYFADNYTKLCTIEADLSLAAVARGRGNFYSVNYDIILLFGMTELKALVSWTVEVSGLSYNVLSNIISE
jgi:hypothetical protein